MYSWSASNEKTHFFVLINVIKGAKYCIHFITHKINKQNQLLGKQKYLSPYLKHASLGVNFQTFKNNHEHHFTNQTILFWSNVGKNVKIYFPKQYAIPQVI